MTLAPLSNNSLNCMGEPSVIVVGSMPNNASYELSRSACRLVYAMGAMMPIVLITGGVRDISPCRSVDTPDDTALRASNAFVVFACIPTDAGCHPAIADGVIQLPRVAATNKKPSPSVFTGVDSNVGEESCVAGGEGLEISAAGAMMEPSTGGIFMADGSVERQFRLSSGGGGGRGRATASITLSAGATKSSTGAMLNQSIKPK
jgi:hypothetical protein